MESRQPESRQYIDLTPESYPSEQGPPEPATAQSGPMSASDKAQELRPEPQPRARRMWQLIKRCLLQKLQSHRLISRG